MFSSHHLRPCVGCARARRRPHPFGAANMRSTSGFLKHFTGSATMAWTVVHLQGAQGCSILHDREMPPHKRMVLHEADRVHASACTRPTGNLENIKPVEDHILQQGAAPNLHFSVDDLQRFLEQWPPGFSSARSPMHNMDSAS